MWVIFSAIFSTVFPEATEICSLSGKRDMKLLSFVKQSKLLNYFPNYFPVTEVKKVFIIPILVMGKSRINKVNFIYFYDCVSRV